MHDFSETLKTEKASFLNFISFSKEKNVFLFLPKLWNYSMISVDNQWKYKRLSEIFFLCYEKVNGMIFWEL
jgi:hypothetical protein